ncbi:hypothetical protein [Youngiibacter multivorans]|uniref:Uncharacterized protein n=1 Tax=Youngiibacter multivorans TaxID=937251 RepID=A0ABS4G0U2_9CLOT|nr:hypothetical protein [Youngiibacter multivorans]
MDREEVGAGIAYRKLLGDEKRKQRPQLNTSHEHLTERLSSRLKTDCARYSARVSCHAPYLMRFMLRGMDEKGGNAIGFAL